MTTKFIAEFTVEFAPVSPEMEEAYWETIHYFSRVMFAEFYPQQEKQQEDIERALIPEVDE